MVRHRGAVSGMRPFAVLLAAILLLTVLAGCVTYIPREDRAEETAAEATETGETTEAATTAAEPEDTTAPDTSFPNEPDDGHTKRY